MAQVKIIAPQTREAEHLRVAAYCRVSSDSRDQLHSYAAQIRSYTEEIAQHDGWELVDVYADEGLTGTRMDQRDDFNRMMRDCRKGKIDRILVKSVSRFARNTRHKNKEEKVKITSKFQKMLRECHLHHCIIRTYYNIYNTLQQESKWLHEAVK